MSVPLEKVFTADLLEVTFPHFYSKKAFMTDVSRLRALVGMRDHGPKIPYSGDGKDFSKNTPSEADLAEVAELRRRLRRLDCDVAMLAVIDNRLHGGMTFF